jgi:uncharacterized membrane protein YcaP (DUF421 family)
MFDLSVPWWEIVVRTLVVYVLIFALLRLSGKRELGQMTPFELVVLLVIANAVQNAMVARDTSLLTGVIAATTLVGVNMVVQRVGHRVPFLEHMLASQPALLLEDGKVIQENLDREDVTLEELGMAARAKGFDDLGEVRAAILEVDGSISIIPKKDGGHAGRRRLRLLKRG